jgi:hypothetical protein
MKTMNVSSEVCNNTGIPFKNPTHLEEARNASSQTELVSMVLDKDTRYRPRTFSVDYLNNEGKITFLPGVKNIKNMGEEQVEELEDLFNTLLRLKPQTYRFHIILGDYDKKTKVKTKVEKATIVNTKHGLALKLESEVIGKLPNSEDLRASLMFSFAKNEASFTLWLSPPDNVLDD